MSDMSEFIKDIHNASKTNRLIFFVGAGVSMISGYDSWYGLVSKFDEELKKKGNIKTTKNEKEEKKSISKDDYLVIPQIFYDIAEDKKDYDKILKSVFSEQKQPNIIHDKILKLNPKHIITTNYDELIEQAALKQGWVFSKIIEDSDIGKVNNDNFLIKAHGDFSKGYDGSKIVLKEEDYLNYDMNFPLISNLIKSYFATYQVVFVGYSLGDYNIRMLLSWVRNIQKDNFCKPYFILNDKQPLDEHKVAYYSKRGLKIIDSSQIEETEPDNFKRRYMSILDRILNYKESNESKDVTRSINYIYKVVSNLSHIPYLRKRDIVYSLHSECDINIYGYISFKSEGMKPNAITTYFSLNDEKKESVSDDLMIKIGFIDKFFNKNGILGIDKENGYEKVEASITINNFAYDLNYKEMVLFISQNYEDLMMNYKKAYFLACLAKYREAFQLYTSIIIEAGEKKNWILYYMGKINRIEVYKVLRQIEDINDDIEQEMEYVSAKSIYKNMPYQFQKNYECLRFLCDEQFFYNELIYLYTKIESSRKNMHEGMYSIGGIPDTVVTDITLNENLKFMYENYLWFNMSKEIKLFVKESTKLVLEKTHFDTIRINDESIFANWSNHYNATIDYNRFVNITMNFYEDDVRFLERLCDLKILQVMESDKINQYILNVIEWLQIDDNWKNKLRITSVAKAIFYLARHIKFERKILKKIFEAILFCTENYAMFKGTRVNYLKGIVSLNGLDFIEIQMIEDFILKQVKYIEEKDDNSRQLKDIVNTIGFLNLIIMKQEDYISNKLSQYVISNENYRLCFFDFYPILNKDAREIITKDIVLNSAERVVDALALGYIDNIKGYEDIILGCLNEAKQLSSSSKAFIIPNRTRELSLVILQNVFMGSITGLSLQSYTGISDEHDLFIDSNNFNYIKFNLAWLKRYNKCITEKLLSNTNAKEIIGDKIKRYILKNPKDLFYMTIVVTYYL